MPSSSCTAVPYYLLARCHVCSRASVQVPYSDGLQGLIDDLLAKDPASRPTAAFALQKVRDSSTLLCFRVLTFELGP